jgi:lysophosphatidylcholine acyltransferase/lyso-PAF acetyltransferase
MISTEVIEFDYSEYLGPDYKTKQVKPKIVPTIICNHLSMLDSDVIIRLINPSFTPSAEFKNVPIAGILLKANDSIFIPRGGNEEQKAKALAVIRDRQEMIEAEAGTIRPMCIYVEGATSNGTHLMQFRKGAFFSEKPIKPMFLKYSYHLVSPAFDTIEFLPLQILLLSSFCWLRCKLTQMPDFIPNEYLFQKHADKGQERWEIYAWAVRDAMMKAGQFGDCKQSLKTKLAYENYMRMNPKAPNPTPDIETAKQVG